MHIRAVLFDLDGTLLNTLADIAAAVNHALRETGQPPHPVDAYTAMVGSGLRETVRRALPADTAEDTDLLDRCVALMSRAYRAEPARRTVPYQGIPELLEELAERSIPAGVLSNKSDELVRTIVSGTLPEVRFAVVRGLADDAPAKPDPTSALRAAEALRAEPSEILLVGDSEIDMQTARNAGMVPVGVAWGFRAVEDLRSAGARHIVMQPGEIVRIL